MQNNQHSIRGLRLTLVMLMAALFLAPVLESMGAREPRRQRDPEAAAADYAANRLLKTGQDLLLAGETERGTEVLKKIIDQFPESDVRFKAYLSLGKHLIEVSQQQQAVGYLNYIRELENSNEAALPQEQLDILLEGLFLTGKAYFQMRQYSSAFPVLRKITNNYPNTIWANEAYYFIGMSHFAQENWNMAIESLSKVGTYIDPDSPTIEYIEAGRRFYVKLDDGDLPVRYRLNEKIFVNVSTKHGDSVRIECIPMAGDSQVFIGSVPTAMGKANKTDAVLQIVGGDEIYVTYVDSNTRDGEKNVERLRTVKVVSTASISYTRGDLESRAEGAYIGQPVFVVLRDIDLDRSDKAETTTVRVVSRYKATETEGDAPTGEGFDLASFLRESSEEDDYQIRDEVMITLTELANPPSSYDTEGTANPEEEAAEKTDKSIHSGIFAGRIDIVGVTEDRPVDRNDNVLSAVVGDEVVVLYTDELHIDGDTPREVSAAINVLSEIESAPRATQYVVSDPVIRARKSVVEATAFLELGRIFKSMGLKAEAAKRCDEGLALVEAIIRSNDPIPRSFREQAFQLKWELEIVKDDYGAAISTCRLFNRLYPHSPIVDQALLGIANAKAENESLDEAINIYRQILALPHSQAKGEAQFRIAQAMETLSSGGRGYHRYSNDQAIAQYKLVAERYPDSEYAGPSLGKLVDYYIETRDYARADDLLQQVFTDHPDAKFLDSMLLKWVLVAYRMKDYRKALEQCQRLIYDYPTSDFAVKAKQILPRIEEKVN